MSLIVFHEFGHFLTAKLFNWNIDGIYIYPLGGITKFNTDVNKPIVEELLVTLMGLIFQIVLFLFIKRFDNTLEYYNNLLLFFNLLPIVPLDGSKLLNIFISLMLPFKRTLSIQIIVSYIFYIIILLFFIFYIDSLFMLIVTFLLVFKIIEEDRKKSYIFYKFLLERYLKRFKYKKDKIVSNINGFYKYKNNIIKSNNIILNEYEILKKYYKKNNKRMI